MMRIDEFDDYKPDDSGTWGIFIDGPNGPRMAARAQGRYDAVTRWAVRNIPAITEILLEATQITSVPDDYGIEKKEYPGLPDDWKLQAIDAKRAYDTLNLVTEVFILPLAWLQGWLKMADEQGLRREDGSYWLWGADVHFGPVDKPVAGGMTYRYMER